MTIAFQLLILILLAVATFLWLKNFPYPSPLIRRFLPARKQWPERQIRGWLETGRFHRGYLAFFYRDPERYPPPGTTVLAPADGLVTSDDVRDGVRYIVIALSFWDMHTQRSPLAGTVVRVESLGDVRTDGEGRDFKFLQEKFCPVQERIVMDTAIGRIAVRLITSVAARRIETWVEAGDSIQRGQRLGRILLGSTVVLELDERFMLNVAAHSHVRAGETVIAQAATEASAAA